MTVRHATFPSKLGEMLVVGDGDAVTGLYFEHHRYPPAPGGIGPPVEAAADPLFARVAQELGEYLAGARQVFDVRVATRGEPFQEQVWARLRTLPYGTRTTYGALAEQLGDKALAQAVGGAVGHNPVSIIIPCHRVVGADGRLTGFAGGLERKAFLLDLEEPPDERAARLF